MKKASLICTVYNEGESIRELLDSIVEQTVTPDEAFLLMEVPLIRHRI